MNKTLIALSALALVGSASASFAGDTLENRDGDRFPALTQAYAPAKAGIEALSRLLAVHLGGRRITVNSVMPGATATDMNAGARDPVASLQIATTIALGRVGQAADIAKVVAFLASDDGGWVTGQQIDASGGQRL